MTRGSESTPEVALDDIVENAPALIYVKDRNGRYLYINKQCEVETGISSEEALGQTDFDLFPPEMAAMYRKDDLRALEGMSPLLFEEPLLVKGTERLYSSVKFPVFGEGEVVGVCGITVDVTEVEPGAAADRENRADAYFGRLLASLTPQEVRVLDLVVTGLSDREIGEKLSLSGDTVRHHVSHLLKKLRKRRAQVIIEMLKRDRA